MIKTKSNDKKTMTTHVTTNQILNGEIKKLIIKK